MDGTGGSPFPSEPNCPKDDVWDGLFNTPDQILSPIHSPPSTGRDYLPSPQQVRVKLPSPTTLKRAIENSKPANTLTEDLIGTISDSSDEELTETAITMTETLPTVSRLANSIILDIITEMSIINDTSMQKDLTNQIKPLKHVLKKLKKITKSLDL